MKDGGPAVITTWQDDQHISLFSFMVFNFHCPVFLTPLILHVKKLKKAHEMPKDALFP